MTFNTDYILKHSIWIRAQELLNMNIFDRLVDIFILSCTIGVCEDKWLEDDTAEEIKTIGRNTITQNEDVQSLFEFLYQNAILNTKNINLSSEERKKLAFDYKEVQTTITPKDLLIKYANFGFSKIVECIDNNSLLTISNIKDLIDRYVKDFDLTSLDADDFIEL